MERNEIVQERRDVKPRRCRLSVVRITAITAIGLALALLVVSKGDAAPSGPSGPSASVGAVTVTGDSASPLLGPALVCAATPNIGVSATVTGTYDPDPTPTTSSNATKCGNSGGANNNFCGTGNLNVLCQQTVKTTTIEFSNQGVAAIATDGNSTTPSQAGSTGMLFSQTLTTPVPGPDDKKTVTVSATASEDVTTTKQTSVSLWSVYNAPGGGSCGGSQIGTTTTTTDAGYPSTDTITSSLATNTGLYVLDVVPPTVGVNSNHPNPITQGSDEFVNLGIKDGSALTPYSISLAATGPGPTTYTAGPFPDAFGGSLTSGAHWGVDNNEENNTSAVFIACDAPLGTYSLQTTTKTQDLCGSPYADITNTTKKNGNPLTFDVIPAVSLPVETIVLSELPITGDYGIDECFNNALVNRKVNNTPGSIHLATTVNPTVVGSSTCATSISGVTVQLTLDSNFKYDRTGASPPAHVFVGNGIGGFDLHNAAPLIEVTTDPRVTITAPLKNTNGGTITVDFGSMSIPVGSTIYVRAHALWNQPTAAPSDSLYYFGSSATATTPGLTNSSQTTIVGNPTPMVTGMVCNANGVLQ